MGGGKRGSRSLVDPESDMVDRLQASEMYTQEDGPQGLCRGCLSENEIGRSLHEFHRIASTGYLRLGRIHRNGIDVTSYGTHHHSGDVAQGRSLMRHGTPSRSTVSCMRSEHCTCNAHPPIASLPASFRVIGIARIVTLYSVPRSRSQILIFRLEQG